MPKLSKFRITTKEVDALVADRDAFYFDAELKGFGVRTKPSGSKTYLVQYKNKEGRTRRVSIGQHGALTPSEARKQASVLLGRVDAGEDPAESKADERKAMTMSQLCDAYLEATDKGLVLGKRGTAKKSSTLVTDRGRIERHIKPLLGNRKVRDVTTPDIVKFMRDVTAGKTATVVKTKLRGKAVVEGGKGTAARTVGLLGGILSYAVSEGIISINPARGVKRPADERRQVRLSADEYRALGKAIAKSEAAKEPWQITAAMRLLALTGCRRGEIEGLRWQDVDLLGHCLRLSDSKTGASVRPLGSAAVTVLEKLPVEVRKGFVFPQARKTEGEKRAFGGLPKAWARVVALAKDKDGVNPIGELTPHGLRHAFASTAHDLGYSELTIAALLGHAAASVTGRYVHQVDEALVNAADKVSEHIAGMMSGTAGANVTNITDRRVA
ncbi:integrase [Labrys miyagiensis]